MREPRQHSTKRSDPTSLESKRREIIKRWMAVYAAHYGREFDENDAFAYRAVLQEVHPDELEAAFLKAMREHKDHDGHAALPKGADVLTYVVPRDHSADGIRHYVIAGDGYCYRGRPSLDANQRCGCRNCAPHLYCQHAECFKLRMLDFRSASGRRFKWCVDHMREHEDSRLVEPKSQFKSQLQKLAESKTMPGSES